MRPLSIAELISHLQDLVDNCGCAPYDPVYFDTTTFTVAEPNTNLYPVRGVRSGPPLNKDLDARSIILSSEPT